MKRIATTILFITGLGLAGCTSSAGKDNSVWGGSGSGSMTSGSTGAAGTTGKTGGADAANADVKGSTSASGATPPGTGERR